MGKILIVPGIDFDKVRDRINTELKKKPQEEEKKIKDSTGIDPQLIINVLGKAKKDLSMQFAAIFAQALNVPLEYILYGKKYLEKLEKDEYIKVPHIANSQDKEKNFVYTNNQPMCAMHIDSIMEITEKPSNIVLYRINSDIMENTFYKGDEVLIDISKKYIVDGGIYAYNSFDFQCIRIRRFSIGIDSLILIADNKIKYESCVANKKDINIIGQVLLSKHFF